MMRTTCTAVRTTWRNASKGDEVKKEVRRERERERRSIKDNVLKMKAVRCGRIMPMPFGHDHYLGGEVRQNNAHAIWAGPLFRSRATLRFLIILLEGKQPSKRGEGNQQKQYLQSGKNAQRVRQTNKQASQD